MAHLPSYQTKNLVAHPPSHQTKHFVNHPSSSDKTLAPFTIAYQFFMTYNINVSSGGLSNICGTGKANFKTAMANQFINLVGTSYKTALPFAKQALSHIDRKCELVKLSQVKGQGTGPVTLQLIGYVQLCLRVMLFEMIFEQCNLHSNKYFTR